jgi:hypothetical protein
MRVEGITEEFVYSLYHAAALFYQAKPWLRLRMNHVMSFVVPLTVSSSPTGAASSEKLKKTSSTSIEQRRRYIQILGGTGQCDIALQLLDDWYDVQNESFINYSAKPNGERYSSYKVSCTVSALCYIIYNALHPINY